MIERLKHDNFEYNNKAVKYLANQLKQQNNKIQQEKSFSIS